MDWCLSPEHGLHMFWLAPESPSPRTGANDIQTPADLWLWHVCWNAFQDCEPCVTKCCTPGSQVWKSHKGRTGEQNHPAALQAEICRPLGAARLRCGDVRPQYWCELLAAPGTTSWGCDKFFSCGKMATSTGNPSSRPKIEARHFFTMLKGHAKQNLIRHLL